MPKKKNNKKLIVILGPTASGKTRLAIKLAQKFNGEIISADSRQVYQEMLIATASPYQEFQNSKTKIQKKKLRVKEIKKPVLIKKIPHYLLHIIPPDQEFNVALYKKLVLEIIKDIQERGKLPFLVGGTGLYISAIVDNLKFPKVPANKHLRKELEKKTAKELFQIYKKLDPEGAKFIERENKRRLIRAIEVSKLTGKPFSQLREKGKPLFRVLQIGLTIPREKLKKRISQRVEKMIKKGLEQEVQYLVKRYSWDLPSLQTIGYQEWKDYFEGKASLDEVKQRIIHHTWQYARRQMTWFKRDKRIRWISTTEEAKNLIKKFLKNHK